MPATTQLVLHDRSWPVATARLTTATRAEIVAPMRKKKVFTNPSVRGPGKKSPVLSNVVMPGLSHSLSVAADAVLKSPRLASSPLVIDPPDTEEMARTRGLMPASTRPMSAPTANSAARWPPPDRATLMLSGASDRSCSLRPRPSFSHPRHPGRMTFRPREARLVAA